LQKNPPASFTRDGGLLRSCKLSKNFLPNATSGHPYFSQIPQIGIERFPPDELIRSRFMDQLAQTTWEMLAAAVRRETLKGGAGRSFWE
jgi:hypothetical protein